MSFLYPLFLAGITAIGIPIILHLIRHQTRKRVTFSSLMFLRTTMPRFKSRSRLENLLLLILRCIIVCLLAFAFARPLLPRNIQQDQIARVQRITLLIDTSASMRRAGMWNQAVNEARSVLENLSPADRACVMSFDQGTKTLTGFEEWAAMDPARRVSIVTEQISRLEPGWALTDVGNALVTAAEAIENDEVGEGQQQIWTHEIVLVSDLQRGSSFEALHSYEWPEHTELAVRLTHARGTTNATAHVVTQRDDLLGPDGQNLSHVRITNSANASSESFNLHWADTDPTAPSGQTIEVYAPAGHRSAVRIPAPADESVGHKLVLTGDDHDFDNTFYVAPHTAQKVNILYIGDDDRNDPQGMLYFARRAFGATGAVEPNLVARPPGVTTEQDTAGAHLIIAADTIEPELCVVLRQYLESGGILLLAMNAPDAAASIAYLAGIEAIESEEADVDGYAMLSQIDFEHPLLAPFSEPRFGDFTQIHFWKYRRTNISDLPGARVLASFDSGDPAWFELKVGDGSLLVLTCGWHPSDSQLALSSKFVPLLYSILEYGGALLGQQSQYFVGEPVPLWPSTSSGPAQAQIRAPDGTVVPLDGSQRTFTQTNLPGFYTVESPVGGRLFAVNLSPKECQTAVMPIEDLENLGVSVKQPSVAAAERTQMLQNSRVDQQARHRGDFAALESEQKLWRWVFVFLLAVSLVEMGLAGWLTRTPSTYEGERI
ncbi:MAG: BatA domain-containing protein [Phycisphaerales bacterium]|nr:MAG: BatA domain-containing protein [Phycisphaerales bacterium]